MKDHDYIYIRTIVVLCLLNASYMVHVYIPLPYKSSLYVWTNIVSHDHVHDRVCMIHDQGFVPTHATTYAAYVCVPCLQHYLLIM